MQYFTQVDCSLRFHGYGLHYNTRSKGLTKLYCVILPRRKIRNRFIVIYPAAAHAQSGVKQSVCLSVNKKILKCVLNARYTALAASKEHVEKENRTYFMSIIPQDQYSSIPCRSNLSIYTVCTGNPNR